MAQETALYLDDVEQVRRRICGVARHAQCDSRLPEELWAAAATAELLQRHGMDVTARALEVEKPSLRKWADRLRPRRQPRV
jgi:hypothetical protein